MLDAHSTSTPTLTSTIDSLPAWSHWHRLKAEIAVENIDMTAAEITAWKATIQKHHDAVLRRWTRRFNAWRGHLLEQGHTEEAATAEATTRAKRGMMPPNWSPDEGDGDDLIE